MSAELVGIDDHVETTAIGDGRPRCAACGYRWPCPDVRLRPRDLDPVERELLDLADIDIGYGVRARIPDGSELAPPGGIVVGVHDEPNDDGELVRVYRAAEMFRGRPRFHRIAAPDIDPALITLPNASAVRRLARDLAAHVGSRTGTATAEELDLLADALDLFRAIA